MSATTKKAKRPATKSKGRNVATLTDGFRVKRTKWYVGPNAPATVDDLPFVSKGEDRFSWWDFTPPKTDYWHVHEMLGRAHAFALLDLINNPAADFPEKIVSYVARDMRQWAQRWPDQACGTTTGFFDVISQFLIHGRADR